jgi:ABC-type nitrate/sulfonate/bicarbonate transport system permease component
MTLHEFGFILIGFGIGCGIGFSVGVIIGAWVVASRKERL